MFFSEEKNQKTFTVQPGPGRIRAMAGEQEFFGSFFHERTSSCLPVPEHTKC
jgi:hypothetical protein